MDSCLTGALATDNSLCLPTVHVLFLVLSVLSTEMVCRLINRTRADGSKLGVHGRLLVIVVSLLIASPFAAGPLLLHPSVPWGFLSLIPAYSKLE